MRSADGEGRRPEPVAQHDTRPVAADARVHDLTQRLVVEVQERRGHGSRGCGALTLYGLRLRCDRRSLGATDLRGRPRTDPVFAPGVLR